MYICANVCSCVCAYVYVDVRGRRKVEMGATNRKFHGRELSTRSIKNITIVERESMQGDTQSNVHFTCRNQKSS